MSNKVKTDDINSVVALNCLLSNLNKEIKVFSMYYPLIYKALLKSKK